MKNSRATAALPFWAVIPAAGVGRRMRTEHPKQYLQLSGRTILEHTLRIFFEHPACCGIVLAIHEKDSYWPAVADALAEHKSKPLWVTTGGSERRDSVLAALRYLHTHLHNEGEKQNPWVFVHDAARPCLSHAEIDRLLVACAQDDNGVILALPVSDTLKQSTNGQHIEKTIPREGIWRALTPQCFLLDTLLKALSFRHEHSITDEASAVEAMGKQPRLIAGHAMNIKITHPQDLQLAELFLQYQHQEKR